MYAVPLLRFIPRRQMFIYKFFKTLFLMKIKNAELQFGSSAIPSFGLGGPRSFASLDYSRFAHLLPLHAIYGDCRGPPPNFLVVDLSVDLT